MSRISRVRNSLQHLRQGQPHLTPLLEYYDGLYAFFEGETSLFLTVKVEPEGEAQRQAEGFPLIGAQQLQVESAAATAMLLRLVGVMEHHGTQAAMELAQLQAALREGSLDLPLLFRSCLERNRKPLTVAAESIGVPPALLEYLVTTALGFALARWRERAAVVPPASWTQGYCPVCGGLPVMGELAGESGGKSLHCATCAAEWNYPRLQCSFCGNTDTATLEYFTAAGDPLHRVDVCRKCCCYLKVVDSRGRGETLPMAVVDLTTLHLDQLAQQEGFTRGKAGGDQA